MFVILNEDMQTGSDGVGKKMCVLEDKVCDNCGKCLYCDLDPEKLCDNCCRCLDIEPDIDYAVIEIDEIIPFSAEDPVQAKSKKTHRRSVYKKLKIRRNRNNP